MRLAVAPERRLVSRAAVVSRKSTPDGQPRQREVRDGERSRAPVERAAASASMVSVVVPEWEMPTAMSPGPSSVALVRAMCGSFHAKATMPDAVQLLLQVGADDGAGADAVDVDASGLGDGGGSRGERLAVELLGGLLDRARVGEGDLGDDVVDGVAWR